MRKLLSVGALLAASAFTLWQPRPAIAGEVGVVVYVHHHHRYHHHHHRYYHHGYYYYR